MGVTGQEVTIFRQKAANFRQQS